jgi:flagellar L-ring protein FlgH
MNNFFKYCFRAAALILLTACVADRSGRGNQSLDKIAAPYESGSIFKAGFNEHPLFEERRARNVGDGLVMNVVDSNASAKKTAAGNNAAGANGADKREEPDRRRSDDVDGQDLTNISNDALLGPVNMTVIDIMDNGNLVITGGRQVSVDEDNKYLRVTGVIDPVFINGGNTIQSTQLGDVRITIDHVRIRGDGTTSRVNEGNSIFGNYFQSVNPR